MRVRRTTAFASERDSPLAVAIRCLAAIGIVSVAIVPGADLLAESASRAPITSSIKTLKVSPRELRIRVRALIRPTLGIIEERADRIITDTSDRVVRRGVLVLKIEMSSTMLAAMLRSDPMLAIADAWGYVLQVEDLLNRPDIRAKYGISSPRELIEAFEIIKGQFRDLVSSVHSGAFAKNLEADVRTWADENPIPGAIYRRPSMDSVVAEKLASAGNGGIFSALGSLEETTADVMTRMDLYTMYVPRLARWEVDLAVDDVTRGEDAHALGTDFGTLSRAADRIATFTETASDLTARERTAVLNAIRNERLAVLDAIRKERIAILQEVEGMRKQLISDAGKRLESVADHIFLRLVQLIVVCSALAAVGLALRGYFLRRNAPKSPD